MYAKRVPLEEYPDVARLVVADPEGVDHYDAGDQVGYQCLECGHADETRAQIYHPADCPLAGHHGRAHYDAFEPRVRGRPTPELQPEHEVVVVKAADGTGRKATSPRNGGVIGYLCSCGNLDEDCFEICHDRPCGLADEDGLTKRDEVPAVEALREVRTNGGD